MKVLWLPRECEYAGSIPIAQVYSKGSSRSSLYRTRKRNCLQLSHMRTGTDPVSETFHCLVLFKISDNIKSAKTLLLCSIALTLNKLHNDVGI
jgi:hypothetical protein